MFATAQRALPLVLLSALSLASASCVTAAFKTSARDAMSRASGCPAEQVQVEELAEARYRATGCQKSEVYVCKAAEHAVVSCVSESSVPPLR